VATSSTAAHSNLPAMSFDAPTASTPSPNLPTASSPTLDDEASNAVWPSYTNLVYVPGKEPTLGNQPHEVQAIVRKAFNIIGEKIIFQNSFPGLAERATWHRIALQSACCSIFEGCSSAVQKRYAKLWRRLCDDTGYIKVLAKLVTRFAYILTTSLTISSG
jgi:hypothetical protein